MAFPQHTSFAHLLRRHRLAHGLTQEELAEQAGLSRRAIAALEAGARRSPRKDTIALLAQALHVSAAEEALLIAAARQVPRGSARQQPDLTASSAETAKLSNQPRTQARHASSLSGAWRSSAHWSGI